MMQDISVATLRNTVPVNTKYSLTSQTDSRTDFRDILAANRPGTILGAASTGREIDKAASTVHQARVLTPPTSTAQPATKTEHEPEYSISIVNNLRPDWDNSTDEIQRAHLFLVPFQSAATISLSKLFEFSLAGDEDGIVKVTNTQISVQWQYQLYGDDREFIESLNARIQMVTQSQESINNAIDRYNSGENLTKDEILDGIIAQYAKTPITMTSFRTMLLDLYSYGALTIDETWLVSRWGGLGIEVVAEAYEYEAWLRGIREEHDEPLFTTPDLIDQFLNMLDERRAAAAEAADKRDKREDQTHPAP